ncbi:MAG: hypothetical protein AAF402_03615 [Pseudomonadota bacterium]
MLCQKPGLQSLALVVVGALPAIHCRTRLQVQSNGRGLLPLNDFETGSKGKWVHRMTLINDHAILKTSPEIVGVVRWT